VDEAAEQSEPAYRIPLTYLLDMLGLRRASAKIEIRSRSDTFGIHVDAGRILLASSSQRTLRLGHLLLQRGAVEPLYLHDVLQGRRSIPQGRALGGVLVAEGAVSQAELHTTVREQVIEVIARVIEMYDAAMIVIADEAMPEGIEIVSLDTDDVIEEAQRRRTERAAIRAMQRLLPAPDAFLRLSTQLGLISHQLTDQELLVALQVERSLKTLDQVGGALPLDPLTYKRAVISLLERGFLTARPA
jgi:hypothetical protein